MTTDELDRCGPPSFVFRVAGLRGARFEGRPLSRPPNGKTLGFLYGRNGDVLQQVGAGVFEDGAWKRLSKRKGPEPSHWVVIVDD